MFHRKQSVDNNEDSYRRLITITFVISLLSFPTTSFGDAELALLNNAGEIWIYTGQPCTKAGVCPGWVRIDSGINKTVQIAGQEDGKLLQRHADGSIWRWDKHDIDKNGVNTKCDLTGKVCPGWTLINNDRRTKEIFAAGSQVVQRLEDGSIWMWSGDPLHCDDTGKVCPGWARISTDLRVREITTGFGTIFIRLDNGAVLQHDRTSHCDDTGKACPGWTLINNDKRIVSITASLTLDKPGPELYQRLGDGSIWEWSGSPLHCDNMGKVCPGWARINADPHARELAAGPKKALFMRQDNGAIWGYDGKSVCDPSGKVCQGWNRINNDARTKDIVASVGTVFQRLGDGSVWKWDGNPCNKAGTPCPGWAPPIDTDPRTIAIVPFHTSPLHLQSRPLLNELLAQSLHRVGGVRFGIG